MISRQNTIIALSVIFALLLQYKLNEINLMYLKRDYDLKLSAIQQKIEISQPTAQPVIVVTVEPTAQLLPITTIEPIAQPIAQQPTAQPVTVDRNNLSMPQVQPVQPVKIYSANDMQMSASATATTTLTLSEIWTTAKTILIDLGLWYHAQIIISIGFVVIIAFIILSYFKP